MSSSIESEAPRATSNPEVGAPFTVMVADNFHYQADEDEDDGPYASGKFDTLAAAINACTEIVDEWLVDALRQDPKLDAAGLYSQYKMFGDDPFIRPAVSLPGPLFSAWDYALRKSNELTNPESEDVEPWWREFD